jgi:hypothetical protein
MLTIGHIIMFDGSGSSGEALIFLWDFGDGNTSSDEISNHSYSTPGHYTVTLTVTDEQAQSQQATASIVVGTPPTATIISPAEGEQFFVGQILQLKGEATDWGGNQLSSSQLAWEVHYHHGENFHPFLGLTFGNKLDLSPAPEPEDFLSATISYLEIILYATDNRGLTASISRNVHPILALIHIDSEPQGMKVLVDDRPIMTPQHITSWANHELRLEVRDQLPYVFVSWSDGGERSHSKYLLATSQPRITLLATFVKSTTCVDNYSPCSTSLECCSDRCAFGACRNGTPDKERMSNVYGGAAGRVRGG